MSSIESIKAKMQQLEISPKRSLGQNFLVNPATIERIVRAAEQQKSERIIEVGPGLGALTEKLRQLQPPLLLIELDRKLAAYWKTKGYEVIEADALKWSWEQLKEDTLLVSNLPYQISSSLVIELSTVTQKVSAMVLMFQKEVAQRMMAEPGGKEYGLLTVVAQLNWQVHNLLEAGPRDFYPAPKVASRVLVFQRRELPLEESKALLVFLKAAFAQRRKLLIKNLKQWGGWHSEKAQIALDLLVDLGYTEKARAEELTPEHLYMLFTTLRS